MIKKLLSLIFIFTYNTIISQDLTCEDFKVGKFYIPNDDKLQEFTISFRDSIVKYLPERDTSYIKTVLVRSEKTQTEWKDGINQGDFRNEIIEWINDCNYRLTYDEENQQLDETEQWINDNNGVIISKIKIERRCMIYDATLTSNEGVVFSQKGIICKEDE